MFRTHASGKYVGPLNSNLYSKLSSSSTKNTTTKERAEVDERDQDGRTPQATSGAFPSSSKSKPQNMHLGLHHSPGLASRFSNFSSDLATPEGSEDRNKLLGRSPSSSASKAGLGLGIPDLSSEARNRHAYAKPTADDAETLQTPEKYGLQSWTPSGTPRVYDRAGQIGIGELATPRWNFPNTALPTWKSAADATPLSSSKMAQRRNVSGALTDDGTAPEPLSISVPESHHSALQREADFQNLDGPQPLSRRGQAAARHSRSISYSSINSMQRNALRDPNELLSTLPISPSAPGRHMPGGPARGTPGLAADGGQHGLTASSSRRERFANSGTPSQPASTAPSMPQGTPRMSRNKRASSASIGQSLLRGSVPLAYAEDYESRLNSCEDAAADALRKLDGLGSTRRASRDGKSDPRSPRTSRVPSRPGSASRRTPASSSRASSPDSRSRRSSNYYTSSRSIDKTRGSEDSIARNSTRASKLVTRVRTGDDSTGTPPHALAEPVRTSAIYSSPRLRRSQLPPLPQNEITQGSRRTSAAQSGTARDMSASASPLIGTPVITRSISRSKRMSGNSDGSVIVSEGSRQNSAAGAYDDPDASKHTAIPPVPPLPKLWEGSRSSSLTSEAFRAVSTKSLSITTSHSFVSTISGDHSDKLPTPRSPLSPRTQEMAEAAALAVRKPSLNVLSDSTSRRSSTNDVLMQCAVAEPIEEIISSTEPLVSAESTGIMDPDSSVTSARPKSSSLRRTSVASLGRLIRTGQRDNREVEAPLSSAASQSLSASTDASSSPKSRRTPSFFQRAPRSSDGPRASEAGVQETGRASRKSILGIAGGLLSRSGSRRVATASNTDAVSNAGQARVSEVEPRSSASQQQQQQQQQQQRQQQSSLARRRGQSVTAGSDTVHKISAALSSMQEPRSLAKASDGPASASIAAQTPSRAARTAASGIPSSSPSVGSRTVSPSKSASLSSRIPRVTTMKAIPRAAAAGTESSGSVTRAAATASTSIPVSKSHHPSLAASMGMVATQPTEDDDTKSVSGLDTTVGTAKHSHASSKIVPWPGGGVAQVSSSLRGHMLLRRGVACFNSKRTTMQFHKRLGFRVDQVTSLQMQT
ncbi:related to putative dual specificity protein kinase pom1 [Ustilago sp. UG-2017b]|nr:related to putative dual specificity protein kinase pom1 [Ustilago sp. UG-2017b]